MATKRQPDLYYYGGMIRSLELASTAALAMMRASEIPAKA
jgi:hypothetical protein